MENNLENKLKDLAKKYNIEVDMKLYSRYNKIQILYIEPKYPKCNTQQIQEKTLAVLESYLQIQKSIIQTSQSYMKE